MQQSSPPLGFVGLGVMGGPMCRNVVTKHPAPVFVFDLNDAALSELAEAGARRAASVAEVAANAEIIFLSLPGGKQVDAVCFGESGILSAAKPGAIVVDLSTTAVAEARGFATRLAEKGLHFVDAPVARTRQAAQAGTLSIMVGATQELFAKVEPLLRYMGSDITHCGEVGGGQVVKLINNALLFEHVAALAEMMVVAERAGVAPATLLEAVSKGSGDSFALRNHGLKAMLPREFPDRSFPAEYVLKDMGYAIDLARETGVDPKMSLTAEAYYRTAVEEGFGPKYFPSIIELIDRSR